MKKLLCFLLCLTLIFSSISLSFAAGWSDSQISSVVSDLSTVKTTLNNIYTRLGVIQGYLFDDSHSVAYWTSAIASWMQPIYTALTSNLKINLGIDQILGGLYKISGDESSGITYTPYLFHNGKSAGEWLDSIDSRFGLKAYPTYFQNNPSTNITYYRYRIHQANASTYRPIDTPWAGLYYYLNSTCESLVNFAVDVCSGSFTTQNVINWGNLQTSTFTPVSLGDGLYKYLSSIQAPVARLSYVLASDADIEAREAATLNQEAVVDNFIDSTGDGATSPSDIGSVSDLSSGYKQNFGSDASPSGIFDIFNSDHATWFSQETKNQLDTTTPTRMSKGSESETPLLDKQIEDIYNALGVKQP